MKIIVSTDSGKWTDFEKKEWAVADQEHYGQILDWTKKRFKIIATEDQETVGALQMEIEVGVAHISSLIVSKDQRLKGVGRLLIKTAEETATENGAHKIYLNTGQTWDAVEFYKKLGYKTTAELPNHYFHTDFIEMTKFL